MDLKNFFTYPIRRMAEVRDKFGWNTFAILFLVYWSQGFKSLSFLAVSLYSKNTLNLDPGVTQLIKTFSMTAWLIKPVYGFITDNFPLCGYNRKSYFCVMGTMGAICMVSLVFHKNLYLAVAALALTELSQAFSDVIADAVMVEKSRNDEDGSSLLQSFSWTVMAIGGVFGSLLGGYLLENYEPSTVIACNAFSPLLLIISAVFLEETPIETSSIKDQMLTLYNAVKSPSVYKPLIFVIILRGSSPRYSELYTYFLVDELKLSPVFMSSLGIFNYSSMMIGGFVYHNFLKNKEYRDILCQGQLIIAALTFIDLGLVLKVYAAVGMPGWSFVLGGEIIGSMVDLCFTSMPLLVMGAKICPVKIEATFFSLFTSVFNIGGAFSGLIGGYLIELFDVKTQQYDAFWLLIVIQICTKFIPLIFLRLLPLNSETSSEESKSKENEMVEIDSDINSEETSHNRLLRNS